MAPEADLEVHLPAANNRPEHPKLSVKAVVVLHGPLAVVGLRQRLDDLPKQCFIELRGTECPSRRPPLNDEAVAAPRFETDARQGVRQLNRKSKRLGSGVYTSTPE
jgi:hypothetical protein